MRHIIMQSKHWIQRDFYRMGDTALVQPKRNVDVERFRKQMERAHGPEQSCGGRGGR